MGQETLAYMLIILEDFINQLFYTLYTGFPLDFLRTSFKQKLFKSSKIQLPDELRFSDGMFSCLCVLCLFSILDVCKKEGCLSQLMPQSFGLFRHGWEGATGLTDLFFILVLSSKSGFCLEDVYCWKNPLY